MIPTGFARGSGEYPIGMTITIYEYRGKFSFDPASVRDEMIPGEAELMDDKPLEPEKLKMVAVTCKTAVQVIRLQQDIPADVLIAVVIRMCKLPT